MDFCRISAGLLPDFGCISGGSLLLVSPLTQASALPVMQMFVSTLKGLGLTTKAVCSFQTKQLQAGLDDDTGGWAWLGCSACVCGWGRLRCPAASCRPCSCPASLAWRCHQPPLDLHAACPQVPPSIARTVRFFHGLSGLENACDAGQVRRLPGAALGAGRGSAGRRRWRGRRRQGAAQAREADPLPPVPPVPPPALPTMPQITPGQFVLFNGASFLADLSANGLQVGWAGVGGWVGGRVCGCCGCERGPEAALYWEHLSAAWAGGLRALGWAGLPSSFTRVPGPTHPYDCSTQPHRSAATRGPCGLHAGRRRHAPSGPAGAAPLQGAGGRVRLRWRHLRAGRYCCWGRGQGLGRCCVAPHAWPCCAPAVRSLPT